MDLSGDEEKEIELMMVVEEEEEVGNVDDGREREAKMLGDLFCCGGGWEEREGAWCCERRSGGCFAGTPNAQRRHEKYHNPRYNSEERNEETMIIG
jgi:hypothetical protein